VIYDILASNLPLCFSLGKTFLISSLLWAVHSWMYCSACYGSRTPGAEGATSSFEGWQNWSAWPSIIWSE